MAAAGFGAPGPSADELALLKRLTAQALIAQAPVAPPADGLACLALPFPPDGDTPAPALCLLGTDEPGWQEESLAAALDLVEGATVETALRAGEGRHRLALATARQNEQRLRLALETASVTLFEQGQDLRYGWVHNPNLPVSAEAALGHTDAELFGPEIAAPLEAIKQRVLAGRAEAAEVTLPLPQGPRIFQFHAEPRHDASGKVIGLIGAAIDITERKQAEEQREILLRELNHRVKNLLAVVQAIAHQTAARTTSIGHFLQAFSGRLGALATAQGRLTEHGWRGVDLGELIHHTLDPLGLADGGRVRTRIENVPLATAAAQSLALALHELATNASKHGALSVPEGQVELSAAVNGPSTAPTLEIVWRERGGPPTRPPTRQGFGTRLLTRVVARQHRGQVHLDWDPAGLVCRLVLPLDQVLDKRRAELAGKR